MNAVDWLFRNPRTGKLTIAQWPNLPLWIFLAASAGRRVADPHGTARTAIAAVAGSALVWWAADEALRGESRFRRLLGAVALAALALSALT